MFVFSCKQKEKYFFLHVNNAQRKFTIWDFILKVLLIALSFGHGRMSWPVFQIWLCNSKFKLLTKNSYYGYISVNEKKIVLFKNITLVSFYILFLCVCGVQNTVLSICFFLGFLISSLLKI